MAAVTIKAWEEVDMVAPQQAASVATRLTRYVSWLGKNVDATRPGWRLTEALQA